MNACCVMERHKECPDSLNDLGQCSCPCHLNKFAPYQWETILDIYILDPDGWDRQNFKEDWAKPLTMAEFRRKAMMSTHCTDVSKR